MRQIGAALSCKFCNRSSEMERSAIRADSRDPRALRFALARFQYTQAEKLYERLERYASTQSVPRHWR